MLLQKQFWRENYGENIKRMWRRWNYLITLISHITLAISSAMNEIWVALQVFSATQRHYATSWKVVGSISDGVIEFFQLT
jgi:hypothetical protein